MNRLHQEMEHMRKFLCESETSFLAWKEHFKDKAQRLAAWDPDEYSQLPMMLDAETRRLELSHLQSKRQERDTRSKSRAASPSEHGKPTISEPASFLRMGKSNEDASRRP